MKHKHTILIFLTVAFLILTLKGVPAASGRPMENRRAVSQREAVNAAVAWILHEVLNPDGGFGIDFGTGKPASDVSSTLDALLALSAAGYNANAPYLRRPVPPVAYLQENAAELESYAEVNGGANGKVIMALAAANQDARNFAGRNFVAKLNSQLAADGSFNNPDAYNQALSVLALTTVGEPVPVITTAWLEGKQADDGSWSDGFGTDQNVDATAMALMALLGAGESPAAGASKAALGFLADSQLPTGGWEYGPGLGENANSTALAVQALAAAGVVFYDDGGAWSQSGRSPLTALLSWQSATGAFQADFGQGRQDNLFATLQAVPAVSGRAHPLPSRSEAARSALSCLSQLQDAASGGWEQFTGFGVNAAGTARAIEAIRSAGSDPQSADWTPGAVNAVQALENLAPAYIDGGRGGRAGIVMQGVVAAGSPYNVSDFAGFDLPAVVNKSLTPDGAYDDTSFGVVAHAEAMLGLLVSGNEVETIAVDFLLAAQEVGDWGSPDGNGAALNVLGRLGRRMLQANTQLRATQQADGGWGFGGPSDPSATSEVVQGLVQQGENPFAPAWSQVVDGVLQNPGDVVLAQQQENGCWANQFGPGDDPFATMDAIVLLVQQPDNGISRILLPVVSGS